MIFNYLRKHLSAKILVVLLIICSQPVYATDYDKVGKAMFYELQGANLVEHDPVINEYIINLGNKLNSSPVGTLNNLNVFVVRDNEINAFAFLGNNIGIHQGLIKTVYSENELAAVLAHEMSHIHLKHIHRTITEHKKLLPVTILAAIGAVVAGSPDLIAAALANHSHQMLRFSRQHEQEADRIGMNILNTSGFNPHAMANAFSDMQSANRYNYKVQEFLSTHPLYESRVPEAENRASQMPYRQAPSSLLYKIARARLEVFDYSKPGTLIANLNEQLRLGRYKDKSIITYKLSLAYAKNNNFKEAIELMSSLAKANSDTWVYQLGLAEIYIMAGNFNKANNILERLQDNFPGHLAITQTYSQSLMKAKLYQDAEVSLAELKINAESLPWIYDSLARISNSHNNSFSMHMNIATEKFLLGKFDAALEQLSLAKKHAPNDSSKNSIQEKEDEVNSFKKL